MYRRIDEPPCQAISGFRSVRTSFSCSVYSSELAGKARLGSGEKGEVGRGRREESGEESVLSGEESAGDGH